MDQDQYGVRLKYLHVPGGKFFPKILFDVLDLLTNLCTLLYPSKKCSKCYIARSFCFLKL